MSLPDEVLVDLPEGWSARVPTTSDIPALVGLVAAHQSIARGWADVDEESVASLVTGTGSWMRRQLVVESATHEVVAWASVHDRAAGHTMLDLTVAPDLGDADALVAVLLGWIESNAADIARQRGVASTQLDATLYVGDARQRRWLTAAGYDRTRTWLHMTRPVDDAGTLPGPRSGVTVRRVAKHEDGMPQAQDLRVVHQMLEESFEDHFNSYRESFPEFVQRLQEDPGHRWDHWWIAEIDQDGEQVPGGALVSSVLSPDESGAEGSYIDYIGVHRRARGRGVAKSLLHTVIRDAHDRGRNRIDLEVDGDSPTGADQLYASMGWTTKYRTESWHADCST
jgi:GNAT superfamily N-acetyltransferase